MAGLVGFLEEIETLLTVAHPDIQFGGLGVSEVDEGGAWPRVVWLVPTVAHAAAEKSKPAGRSTAVQILTRGVNVEAHLWCEDLEQLEQLIDDTIAAVHDVSHGSVLFGGEEWPEDDAVEDGLRAIVRFRIDARVRRRRWQQLGADDDSRFTTTQPTDADVDTTNTPD